MADDGKPSSDDVLSTLSREFLVFDVIPVLVAASGISVALLLTDGFGKSPDASRLVEDTLAVTPTALAIWWFGIIGLAVVSRPFLRVAVRLASGDPGQAIRDALPVLSERRPMKSIVNLLNLYGPFGSARRAHAQAVGSQGNGRTLSEIERQDPLAYKVIRDHRERWELSLRLSLGLLIGSVASAPVLVNHSWWFMLPTFGLVSAVSLYFQSIREYRVFSTVFVAGRKVPTGD